MPSDEPISLTTLATILTATAAATSIGVTAYSLAQGTPEVPKMPEIPQIPETPLPPPTAETTLAAPDLTKPTPTLAETTLASQSALALRRRQGRASTLLTGPSGLYSNTATASPVKTLLGA